MKKINKIYILLPLFFVLSIFVFIFAITDTSAREEKPFTIAFTSNSDLGKYAYAYKMANRDIEIELLYFDRPDKYEEAMAEMFESGDLPDVFLVNDPLLQKYATSPYFCNLNELIDADPELNRSDFYENVLDAFQTGDKLPVIPFRFVQLYVGINHELADKTTPKLSELEYLDLATAIEMYESLDSDYKEKFYSWAEIAPFSAMYRSGYLDLSKNTANLENEGFVNLLEKSTKYQIPEDMLRYFSYYEDYYEEHFADRVFVSDYDVTPYTFLPYEAPYKDFSVTENENHEFLPKVPIYLVDRVPFFTYDGRNIIESGDNAAIFSGSKRKDMAWDFIKFSISEDMNKVSPFLDFFHTIVRDVNEKLLRDTMTEYIKSFNNNVITEKMFVDIDNTMEFLLKPLEREQFACSYSFVSDTQSVLEAYYEGNIAAYDAAVKMQRMLDIYFIEK